jgi:hypothetical protein
MKTDAGTPRAGAKGSKAKDTMQGQRTWDIATTTQQQTTPPRFNWTCFNPDLFYPLIFWFTGKTP